MNLGLQWIAICEEFALGARHYFLFQTDDLNRRHTKKNSLPILKFKMQFKSLLNFVQHENICSEMLESFFCFTGCNPMSSSVWTRVAPVYCFMVYYIGKNSHLSLIYHNLACSTAVKQTRSIDCTRFSTSRIFEYLRLARKIAIA